MLNRYLSGANGQSTLVCYVCLFAVMLVITLSGCGGGGGSNEPGIKQPAGPQWSNKQKVESTQTDALAVELAVNNNTGELHAIWQQRFNGWISLWVNRRLPDGAWGVPERIAGASNIDIVQHKVAIDGQGKLFVVWIEEGGLNNIYSNQYIPGTGWGTSELLSDYNVGFSSDPEIAATPDGRAMVVWAYNDHTSQPTGVMVTQYTQGSGWSTGVRLDIPVWGISDPTIVLDDNGDALVVWHIPEDSISQTQPVQIANWHSRYTVNGGWETPVRFDEQSAQTPEPLQIAGNRSGYAMALWREYDNQNERFVARRYTPTGLDPVFELHTLPVHHMHNPTVVMDGLGNAVVAWTEPDNANDKIVVRYYTADQGWSAPQTIDSQNSPQFSDLKLAANRNGNISLLWNHSHGGIDNTGLHASYYQPDIGWLQPSSSEPPYVSISDSNQIILDEDGKAYIAWTERNQAQLDLVTSEMVPQ